MAYQFEIIGVLFAFIMIYLTLLEYKKKRLSRGAMWFWNIFWVAGLLLIVFHYQVNAILPALNIIRALDLYMILAFIFLFAIVFYLFINNKRTESRVEELTRILALKDVKKER
jgi:hypothetical protein